MGVETLGRFEVFINFLQLKIKNKLIFIIKALLLPKMLYFLQNNTTNEHFLSFQGLPRLLPSYFGTPELYLQFAPSYLLINATISTKELGNIRRFDCFERFATVQ